MLAHRTSFAGSAQPLRHRRVIIRSLLVIDKAGIFTSHKQDLAFQPALWLIIARRSILHQNQHFYFLSRCSYGIEGFFDAVCERIACASCELSVLAICVISVGRVEGVQSATRCEELNCCELSVGNHWFHGIPY